MSFTVSQASGELALRAALGAAPSALPRSVLRSGLVLMILASVAACILPAWRVLRPDPSIALRGRVSV